MTSADSVFVCGVMQASTHFGWYGSKHYKMDAPRDHISPAIMDPIGCFAYYQRQKGQGLEPGRCPLPDRALPGPEHFSLPVTQWV